MYQVKIAVNGDSKLYRFNTLYSVRKMIKKDFPFHYEFIIKEMEKQIKYKEGFSFKHNGKEYECLIANDQIAVFGEVLWWNDISFIAQKHLFTITQGMPVEEGMRILEL